MSGGFIGQQQAIIDRITVQLGYRKGSIIPIADRAKLDSSLVRQLAEAEAQLKFAQAELARVEAVMNELNAPPPAPLPRRPMERKPSPQVKSSGPSPVPQSVAGLEGLWHPPDNPDGTWQFWPDGTIIEVIPDEKYGDGIVELIWTRNGDSITAEFRFDNGARTFKGHLENSRLVGKTTLTQEGNQPNEWDTVLVR